MKYTLLLITALLLVGCGQKKKDERIVQEYIEEMNARKEAKKVDWLLDTISLTPASQQNLNQLLDTLLLMIHSDDRTMRLSALSIAIGLAPTILWNYDNPSIDSLLQVDMINKYQRIDGEWYVEKTDDGHYWFTKEVIKNDGFIEIDILLEEKMKQCKGIVVSLSEEVENPILLFFLKGDEVLDTNKERTIVRFDPIILERDESEEHGIKTIGLPEYTIFENFLINKTLTIGYFIKGEYNSAILSLNCFHTQYNELFGQ